MTLFLLPGLMCDRAIWEGVLQKLSDRIQPEIPVFRGFDSLTKMAESVLEKAPEHFLVAGHSMGGRVALEIMRLAGARVEKLALLDTGVHPKRQGEEEKRRTLLDLARAKGMQAVAEAWITPMLHPLRQHDSQLFQSITEMIERNSVEDFAGQVQALLNRPAAAACLADIACPALVLCGRQDGWSPLEQHEYIARNIRDSRLVIIEDAGHMSPMEQPATVAAALNEWIKINRVSVD